MNELIRNLRGTSLRVSASLTLLAAALWISLSHSQVPTVGDGSHEVDGIVRVGLPVGVLDPIGMVDAQLALDRVFELALSDTLRFKSTIYKGGEAFYEGFTKGEIDVAPMSIDDYLALPDGCDITPVLQGLSDTGGGGVELILLAGSEFDLASLVGKKLLIDKMQPLAGKWLDLVLADAELGEKANHFGVLAEREAAKDVVLQTFFGSADACITSKQAFETLTELNPSLRRKLKTLAVSTPFAHHVICFHDGLDANKRMSVIDGLRAIHKKPNGKQILLLTKIDRIDFCEASLVEAAQSINDRWSALDIERKVKWLEAQKQHTLGVAETTAEQEGEGP